MNLSREHHAYQKRGGELPFKKWLNARSHLDDLTVEAVNWCDSNGDKPLVEYPRYPILLGLEKDLKLTITEMEKERAFGHPEDIPPMIERRE